MRCMVLIFDSFVVLTRCIYMFALRKPGEERFSERSEAVVLLTILLSGIPVGIVYRSDLQTTLLRVLSNFRARRKISWRHSFYQCLYPVHGECLSRTQ